MKLCWAFYGHGCMCNWTQAILKLAGVCLGNCEPACHCPPGIYFVLGSNSLDVVWCKVCMEGIAGFEAMTGCEGTKWCWAVSSHSILHGLYWQFCGMTVALCALSPGGDAEAPVRAHCPLRFLVGVGVCAFLSVVRQGVWGGRESSCRNRTADGACYFSSCFLSHFKTGVWYFNSVSIVENSGLLVWVFNLKKIFILYLYIFILKWEEWQGNAFNKWNTLLGFYIPMNRECRCLKPKEMGIYSVCALRWAGAVLPFQVLATWTSKGIS